MAGHKGDTAEGIGYPQLHREDIDLIIDQLIFTVRERDLGHGLDRAESVLHYLTNYYTRRWGLPPAITGRIDRIRELAADAGLLP